MVLARNREITGKQVFGINDHEILIFQYYSKNKYCSNFDVTYTYKFLYKFVNLLQSYWPLKTGECHLELNKLVRKNEKHVFGTEVLCSITF